MLRSGSPAHGQANVVVELIIFVMRPTRRRDDRESAGAALLLVRRYSYTISEQALFWRSAEWAVSRGSGELGLGLSLDANSHSFVHD